MTFRRRPLTTPEQIADLYEQVRVLQERLRTRTVGSLTLGAVVEDGDVVALEMVDPDEVSIGWAGLLVGSEPAVARVELLDATGAVVGWWPIFLAP